MTSTTNDPDGLETCDSCKAKDVVCKKCSRCRMTFYCSRKCQKKAYGWHKYRCQKVGEHLEAFDELDRPRPFVGDDKFMLDLVADYLGVDEYWTLHSQKYHVAGSHLVHQFVRMGEEEKNKRAYKEALRRVFELIRLGNHLLRYFTPFIMLALNLQQDCYDFIKWWATIGPDGRYNWGQMRKSKPGEWVYLRKQNIMEDLFTDRLVRDPKDFNSYHLLALILIKLLIMKDIEKSLNRTKAAFLLGTNPLYGVNSPVLKIVNQCPIIDRILYYITVNSGMVEQKRLFDKYCSLLDTNNPRVLKGVAYPKPLLSQQPPKTYELNSAAEAYQVVEFGDFAFKEHGFDHVLRLKYGKQPEYDWEIISEHYISNIRRP